MQGRKAVLLAVLLLTSVRAATACELAEPGPGQHPLQSRKPVQGEDVRLITTFGMRKHPILNVSRLHTGVDWAAPLGTPVTAAAAGRVAEGKQAGEYGNAVFLDHGGGWRTIYAHLQRYDVREGDCVAFGTVIGTIGSTGLVSGVQLHFEVQLDGRPVDPLSLLIGTPPQ